MTYTFDDNTYSDLYKEVYGMRPNWSSYDYWNSLSDSEKQVRWDFLVEKLTCVD